MTRAARLGGLFPHKQIAPKQSPLTSYCQVALKSLPARLSPATTPSHSRSYSQPPTPTDQQRSLHPIQASRRPHRRHSDRPHRLQLSKPIVVTIIVVVAVYQELAAFKSLSQTLPQVYRPPFRRRTMPFRSNSIPCGVASGTQESLSSSSSSWVGALPKRSDTFPSDKASTTEANKGVPGQ